LLKRLNVAVHFLLRRSIFVIILTLWMDIQLLE